MIGTNPFVDIENIHCQIATLEHQAFEAVCVQVQRRQRGTPEVVEVGLEILLEVYVAFSETLIDSGGEIQPTRIVTEAAPANRF